MSIDSPDFLARVAAEEQRRSAVPTEVPMTSLERTIAAVKKAAIEKDRAERLANITKLLEAEKIAKSLAHLALTKLPKPVPTDLVVARRMYGGLFNLFYKGDDILAEGWILGQKINGGSSDEASTFDGVFLDIKGPLRAYRAYDEHPSDKVWYPRDDAVTGWSHRAIDGYEGIDYVADPHYGKETFDIVHEGQRNAEYIMGLLVTFATDHQLVAGPLSAV